VQLLRVEGDSLPLKAMYINPRCGRDQGYSEERVDHGPAYKTPSSRGSTVLEAAGVVHLALMYAPQHNPGACMTWRACHLPQQQNLMSSQSQTGTKWQGCCVTVQTRTLCVAQRFVAAAAGDMIAWEGRGTQLPPGFVALRMHTNSVRSWANEWYPDDFTKDRFTLTTNPAQLLCRALRLAPSCYRRFELRAAQPAVSLFVEANVWLKHSRGGCVERHTSPVASFETVAQFAAALQQCTDAEGVSVSLSPNERSVIIDRAWSAAPACAADVLRMA